MASAMCELMPASQAFGIQDISFGLGIVPVGRNSEDTSSLAIAESVIIDQEVWHEVWREDEWSGHFTF